MPVNNILATYSLHHHSDNHYLIAITSSALHVLTIILSSENPRPTHCVLLSDVLAETVKSTSPPLTNQLAR